ncbi:MAG: hypothetical protein GF349_03435 [Candidatus Magasanikbacteria bacterium]|nr:hypothetical protein [Candidatus Magasanikbacteria bacterium]
MVYYHSKVKSDNMKKRREKILKLIVDNYVLNTDPVGSKFLAEKGGLGVSGATLRNEMRDMEKEGFLSQPHTSAGRIPTEKGYKYYIENILEKNKPDDVVCTQIKKLIDKKNSTKENKKKIAKYLANLCNCAVIIAFDGTSIYYTGLSNLFSQPEFREYKRVLSFSSIFDEVEDKVEDLYSISKNEKVKILIGSDSPFGSVSSSMIAGLGNNDILTVLGPIRMNYHRNYNLLNFIQSIFNN